MIGIRTVTYTLPPDYTKEKLDIVRKCSLNWSSSFERLHTQRMVLCPVTDMKHLPDLEMLDKVCDVTDIRWYNVPIDPWKVDDLDECFDYCRTVLARGSRSFVNVLSIKEGKVRSDILKKSFRLIRTTSKMSNNGKDNFRLGCSVNTSENGAFFPFTQSGGELGFSIGLEMIEERNQICLDNQEVSLEELRELFITRLRPQIDQIYELAKKIAKRNKIKFHGFDFSIAPMISKNGSVITLLSRLGVYNFGSTGQLFATSYYTDIIKGFAKYYPTVGFSGIMYSVLEDLGICMINNEKGIHLDDLIKVSTMCGCGVDMVPVVSDISDGELMSIFKDMYAISTRLHKPIGIRILPIPTAMRSQVTYTDFNDDADFIANTRVMKTDCNISRVNNIEFQYL